MQLENLRKQDVSFDGDGFRGSIKFDHVERAFSNTDRNHVLYSQIQYETDDFTWSAVLPTVEIPYRDPAVGFLLGGTVFSSVGIYQRAPGVVLGKEADAQSGDENWVDIVTSRNSTLGIGVKRGGIQIEFRKGGHERNVPIGVFLKAYTGLPYSVILEKFAYKPPALSTSFPCEVPQRSVLLSSVDTYGIDSDDEPNIEECVDAVYSAILRNTQRSANTHYSAHWKANRIKAYFHGLHFKTVQNYEGTLSVHARALHTYLDQDLNISVFNEDGAEDSINLPRGTFIDEDVADILQWHDVHVLRVRTTRSFLLQEDNPMLFRAVGCKLTADLPALQAYEGDVIDKDLCKRLNDSDLMMLEVATPEGTKVISRSGDEPELGDFCTILNLLFTSPYLQHDSTSQYEIANRIVVDYEHQVAAEVEQTYQDIISAIGGAVQLQGILDSLPRLPSTRLHSYLRDSNTKELAQADNTNVMARAIAELRASAGMRETPAAMTAVQKGQYARIDSLHSPESDKVGSVQEVTAMARLNPDTGELDAPYEVVRNGVPTGEIEYVSAAREVNKYIVGWNDDLSTPTVMARYNNTVTTVDRMRVDYRDASPFCDMSVSRMTIPFPEFSQPRRSLMATKMNGQAVPLLFPERPIVSTGADTEIPCLYYTGRQVVDSCLGDGTAKGGVLEIVSVKWEKAFANYTCIYRGNSFVFSVPFLCTDKESLYNYNLNYVEGYKYGMDDVVFFNQSCDMNVTTDDGRVADTWVRVEQGAMPIIKNFGKPALALGTNLVVMFKTFGSSTVDDAVVISDAVIADRKLTTMQVMKYSYELKIGEGFATWDTVPQLHSWVYAEQPVIKVLRKQHLESNNPEKFVYAEQAGEVIYTEVDETARTVEVWVASVHDPICGDKVAGRYGNKSVIARIVPAAEMPYDPETGQVVHIICSPLGIPSRMNYGLVVEMTLGAALHKENKWSVVTPFYPGIKDDVIDLAKRNGVQAKRMYLPKYGKYTERPVMVGVMYFMKLEQMANLKYAAVGYPTAVDPIFGQPVSSVNTFKGQELGEMETWSLIAAGADKILNNLFTLYAPDEQARKDYFEMLLENPDKGGATWDEHQSDVIQYREDNRDAVTTQTVVRMFGLDVDIDHTSDKFQFVPLDFDNIPITATLTELKNHNEPTMDNEWCKVKLQAPVVNPFWVNNFPLHTILGVKSVRTLVAGTHYLNVYDRSIWSESELKDFNRRAMITGIDAVIALLRNTTIEQVLERLTTPGSSAQSDEQVVTVVDDTTEEFDEFLDVAPDKVDIVRFLKRMKAAGLDLKDLVWEYMPIMPKVFRQTTIVGGKERERSFQKQLRHICECSRSQDIYNALTQFIGYGESKDDDLVSIRGYFFGKGSKSGQHGTIRGNVLSKRVGFSGRTVIIPAQDPEMTPFQIGVPWRVALIQLAKVLAIRIRNRNRTLMSQLVERVSYATISLSGIKLYEWEKIIESLYEFNPYVFDKYFGGADRHTHIVLYNLLRAEIKKICEANITSDGKVLVDGVYYDANNVPENATIDGMVVMVGRQPTLHKRSIRAFFGILVDGYAMQIHPLVCSGYNADFDGDAMWLVQLMGEMKNEAWHTISYLQDLVSEKDGSYTIAPTQDTVLGLYLASIFKDNTATFSGTPGNFYAFNDAKELRMALEHGDLHYYDVVVFNAGTDFYISTAGRVLLNAVIPGALTQLALQDKWGICKQVLGEQYLPCFKELRYDTTWVATGIKPSGRESTVKIERVLLDVYQEYGEKASVMANQALYEIGLAASDLYSVTTSIDDMSVDVNLDTFMEEPRKRVSQLNTLEQMGLITEQERKDASVRAWEKARKIAMDAVIKAIPENSNTHLMMYSGARGKPDQVMQAVGFIGTINKSATEDIEYPILKGYGAGLSAIDLCQTREMARIGVVSTQAGTKNTGYSTRQTVYMSSGMRVADDDCGITMRVERVPYSYSDVTVIYPDGSSAPIESLVGKGMDPNGENVEMLLIMHPDCGCIVDDEIIDRIVQYSLTSLGMLDGTVTIHRHIVDSWKQRVLESGYSYALPFTHNRKITAESLEWVQEHGLREIVLFDQEDSESGNCFDREAYLPVDYDRSRYTVRLNGYVVGDEAAYGRSVSEESEGFYLFKRLLDEGNGLTVRALRYLTKKGVSSILFENGAVATIRYEISGLFKSLVIGRVSAGVPALDADDCITKETIAIIEDAQLEAIPVRTSLTCLCQDGMCAMCTGKSPTTGKFNSVGADLGISAAQAQCEPLSQATLNVTHSGGKRSAGVGLVSGLSYYMKMLKGQLVSEKNLYQLEAYAGHSGYVECNKHDSRFFQIVGEDGSVLESWELDDAERLNVPDGAYVNVGDTVRVGLPVLNRYSSHDIFMSCLKTRYMLLGEFYKIFSALNVSPRNYEILAREQTSICYLDAKAPLPSTQDTSYEVLNPTGSYALFVAKQPEVVNKYSGIAGFAFENVANMLTSGILSSGGLKLNSVLGNVVTGTPVGSRELRFIPKNFQAAGSGYKKSAVREVQEKLKEITDGRIGYQLELSTAPEQHIDDVAHTATNLLDDLRKAEAELGPAQGWEDPLAMPELEVQADAGSTLPGLDAFAGFGVQRMQLGDSSGSDDGANAVDVDVGAEVADAAEETEPTVTGPIIEVPVLVEEDETLTEQDGKSEFVMDIPQGEDDELESAEGNIVEEDNRRRKGFGVNRMSLDKEEGE